MGSMVSLHVYFFKVFLRFPVDLAATGMQQSAKRHSLMESGLLQSWITPVML